MSSHSRTCRCTCSSPFLPTRSLYPPILSFVERPRPCPVVAASRTDSQRAHLWPAPVVTPWSEASGYSLSAPRFVFDRAQVALHNFRDVLLDRRYGDMRTLRSDGILVWRHRICPLCHMMAAASLLIAFHTPSSSSHGRVFTGATHACAVVFVSKEAKLVLRTMGNLGPFQQHFLRSPIAIG